MERKKDEHYFHTRLEWTEETGGSTLDYQSYNRSHLIKIPGKAPMRLSAAPQYLGDPERLNPEELFTMALSSCQMLTYLALASGAGIRVLAYTDEAEGILKKQDQKMRMACVLLRPKILVSQGTNTEKAMALVEKAHAQCFIANSVTSEIVHRPEIVLA
ncbi:MAG: OsmC family protein [Nitrospiria bacterium]